MKYIKLGRTGLTVSKAGLGCGGHSRLGLGKGLSEENAVNIVNTALDLGINFFDTSAVYGTENVLSKGLTGSKRSNCVISTKFPPTNFSNEISKEGDLTKSLEESLKRLKTDYIDIFNLHAVLPKMYIKVRDRFMPELIKAKDAGKIRFLGITEMFGVDTNHKMLETALTDDIWEVIMTGYNLINFSASKNIFPLTRQKQVGVLIMFAVRNALSNNEKLIETLNTLNEKGEVDLSMFDNDNPFSFLGDDESIRSIIDAAYRFCAHSEGTDVILTGTSSAKHLKSNVESILSPPLNELILSKIYELFGNVTSASAD